MAQDQVTLYNLALSAVGTRARVVTTTERTREAEICHEWYEPVRDQLLRAAHWASCREVAKLTLDAERTDTVWVAGDPEPPWHYRYALPSDFLYPRHLDTFQNFALTQKAGVVQLLTDHAEPILTYTKKQTTVSAWDADLWYAMIQALAGHIAMPLHGKPGRAQLAIQNANDAIMRARLQLANADMVEMDSLPDWLLARGVNVNSSFSRFIYQYGPVFNTGAF